MNQFSPPAFEGVAVSNGSVQPVTPIFPVRPLRVFVPLVKFILNTVPAGIADVVVHKIAPSEAKALPVVA